MMHSTILDHAAICAALQCCTTPSYLAVTLNSSPDFAASVLRELVSDGLFRRVMMRGSAGSLCYQPTAKAIGICARGAPKFLRAGISSAALSRGLLRGGAVFVCLPGQRWLAKDAQTQLCNQYGIPHAGHAMPLVSLDHAMHHHIYVPVLAPFEQAKNVIYNAIARWLPLLEKDAAHLHFIATTGHTTEAIKSALAELTPGTQDKAIRELAELDTRIAADRSGIARIELCHRRSELAATIAHAPRDGFPWLASTILEVQI